MIVYQISCWSDAEDQWIPVVGFPLYRTVESADAVMVILQKHPLNKISFATVAKEVE